MEVQPVDHLVHDLALRPEGDADEIELIFGDGRNGGAVRLVVTGLEQLLRVDRQLTFRLIARSYARRIAAASAS